MSSYIDSLNQATTASTGKSTAKTKAEATMGKEDFLKLLVAQLQNQDPLSPDDPTAFTAQLAQFSSLEQLTTLNESMNTLVTSNSNSDRLSTLNTIGKDVAYSGSSFNYSGSSIELGYNLDAKASSVSLALQLNGATVATLDGKDLTVGNHYIVWDGLTTSGAQAASGKYTIVLQAKAADGGSVAATPLIKSEVTGVDLGGESGGTLVTKAGEISFNAIIGVYDPSSRTVSTTTATTAKTTATTAKTVEETAADVKSTTDSVAEITEDVTAVL
ncbi:MAG: flagellar hook capping FlgD N-terminal domain-containing protein [Pseudomonadota bacterium]